MLTNLIRALQKTALGCSTKEDADIICTNYDYRARDNGTRKKYLNETVVRMRTENLSYLFLTLLFESAWDDIRGLLCQFRFR